MPVLEWETVLMLPTQNASGVPTQSGGTVSQACARKRLLISAQGRKAPNSTYCQGCMWSKVQSLCPQDVVDCWAPDVMTSGVPF